MSGSNVVIIIQARMSSNRLPGKILMPILGEPMIIHQIRRIREVKNISSLIVATSDDVSDNEFVDELTKRGIDLFRGSLNDVLDRYYQTAKKYEAKHVVRITGDCPLLHYELIENILAEHLDNQSDYTSNIFPPTYPDGLDVEIIKMDALEKAWVNASKKSDREHVTTFIRNNPDVFVIRNVYSDIDYSMKRWTVDEPEDFKFIETIFKKLYPESKLFSFEDILMLLNEKPEYEEINAMHTRNEGLLKSLMDDS